MNNYAIDFTPAQLARGDHETILKWSLRWPNFSPDELACKCCGHIRAHKEALNTLQRFREMWRRPVIITSGYRCPKHNEEVGGEPGSLHMQGRAFDIATKGTIPHIISMVYYGSHAGFRGFGYYPEFVHMDLGPHRTW